MSDDYANDEHRDSLINQSIDHLQRNGWFEPAEPFILSTKTAKQGIDAIHEAKQLLLRLIHPYDESEGETSSASHRSSQLIVTLDAVIGSLQPVAHGEDPKSLMIGSFAHRDPRKHGEFNEDVNKQIVAAVDCMKRHRPENKNPSARLAVVLKRLGVPNKSERTVRNLWNDREGGHAYAYDKKGFQTVFWFRFLKRTYKKTKITQSDIEAALKESIEVFQDSKRAREIAKSDSR